MTRNRNLMSTAAAVLAIAAMLSFGTVTPSQAGSNDGGPFRYTTQPNGPDGARAAVYPKGRRNVQIGQTRRAPASAAPDAYGSYAADREPVASAPAWRDFPRGAQGGW
jgi:hypothetical protein